MDIDSQNFDPKRYILTMLKQNSIKQLIRKNNDIEQQIKAQDHQIQSLVFQNYSKFISSIDTVRQMKDNICLVDGRLKELDSSMDKISDLAMKIDSTFKYKRKQIQKLDTVNKDLQKLKNLCDFPNVLKQDLAEYKATHEDNVITNFVQGPKLFNKSITVYQECYKTLLNLKSEPLIQPIYSQSQKRIVQLRSILRTRQVSFNKQHKNSNALRVITRFIVIISDQQNQITALRSYFHSWKQRFIFKRKNQKLQQNQKYDKSISLPDLINNSKIPQMNQQFWLQFQREFTFIFEELYPKLILTEQTSHLLSNYVKQIFNWVVTNQLQQIIQYSSTMKVYVHANHYIVKNLKEALSKIMSSKDDSLRTKLYVDLKQKLFEKVQKLGVNMLNFVFGRLKLAILQQLSQSKKSVQSITISQDFLKDTYIKILGPIKQSFKNNFQPILNDLQHVQSSHQHIFHSPQNYYNAIHEQIQSLIIFLGYSISVTSGSITQQIYAMINKSQKLYKLQKNHIQNCVKDFYNIEENNNGAWFAIAHNYLNYINNQLGKKIIQSAHKRIQISQNHNYAHVFNYVKDRITYNLVNLVKFYTGKIQRKLQTENVFINTRQFIQIVNSIFPDNRRNIQNKPQFLNETKSTAIETELMTVRKMRIIQKKVSAERGNILSIFIHRLLKLLLLNLRAGRTQIDPKCIYSIVQLCYQIGNVDQQLQMGAYYQLLLTETKKVDIPKQALHKNYMQARKKHLDAISH